MNFKMVSGIVLSSLLVTACAPGMGPSNSATGAVLGGIAGGALGSNVGGGRGKIVATIVGALAGAALGGAIGNSMDETDRQRTASSLETARDQQPVAWTNPNTNSQYTVTPTNTYQTSAGQYCRDYSMKAVVDGKRETVYGKACRQPDGTWRTVQS
ncbi:MAG: hypothetical protein RL368_370 [Pseudomonadota bacterium]|jgi:surface antigen